MASDFDSLFTDDSKETTSSQGGGDFDFSKMLDSQLQQMPQYPQQPYPQQQAPINNQMGMINPMGWDNGWMMWGNMFEQAQNFQVATSRGAFNNAFRNNPWEAPQAWLQMIDNQPRRSFGDTLQHFLDINKKVYTSFNILQLVFIVLGMGIASYLLWLLKSFLVYIILYNSHYLSFFDSLQPLVIFIIYAGIVVGVFEFLDGSNDRWRETLLAPFKWWLVGLGVLYLWNIVSFEQLFTIFYFFVLPLVFVKLFCFSEKEVPADVNQAQATAPVQTQQATYNPAEELDKKLSDTLSIDLPEQESTDLLIEETDDEVEIYDLGAEMITASKQRGASAFVLTNRGNISNPKIFYLDIDTETEMFAGE